MIVTHVDGARHTTTHVSTLLKLNPTLQSLARAHTQITDPWVVPFSCRWIFVCGRWQTGQR